MNIKIIRYPYEDHEIGDIVDLGQEKNESMVAMQRGVWYDEGEMKKIKEKTDQTPSDDPEEEIATEETPVEVQAEPKIETTKKKKKKFLQNELQTKIQEKKADEKKGFWDKLR